MTPATSSVALTCAAVPKNPVDGLGHSYVAAIAAAATIHTTVPTNSWSRETSALMTRTSWMKLLTAYARGPDATATVTPTSHARSDRIPTPPATNTGPISTRKGHAAHVSTHFAGRSAITRAKSLRLATPADHACFTRRPRSTRILSLDASAMPKVSPAKAQQTKAARAIHMSTGWAGMTVAITITAIAANKTAAARRSTADSAGGHASSDKDSLARDGSAWVAGCRGGAPRLSPRRRRCSAVRPTTASAAPEAAHARTLPTVRKRCRSSLARSRTGPSSQPRRLDPSWIRARGISLVGPRQFGGSTEAAPGALDNSGLLEPPRREPPEGTSSLAIRAQARTGPRYRTSEARRLRESGSPRLAHRACRAVPRQGCLP
jgi:hypothetical protein